MRLPFDDDDDDGATAFFFLFFVLAVERRKRITPPPPPAPSFRPIGFDSPNQTTRSLFASFYRVVPSFFFPRFQLVALYWVLPSFFPSFHRDSSGRLGDKRAEEASVGFFFWQVIITFFWFPSDVVVVDVVAAGLSLSSSPLTNRPEVVTKR